MDNSLVVGYLESWSPNQITFTQAAKSGYNTIVMAFETINGETIGISDGNFNPSPTPQNLREDIKNAKANGAKHILFSVGGENNTYNPKGSADDVAQALVAYLQEYGFTGVDFDLEINTDGNYLDQLCAGIQKRDPSLIITAAPQLNQADHASDLFLVSTGNYRIYDKAIQNNRFNYLFIQAYNNGWPSINGYSEMNVPFISAAFNNLKKSIPAQTKIVMGEPATKDAAGSYSVFNGPNAGPNIYSLMADQYKAISNDPQFGGVMTWDINWDAKNNYQFVKAMNHVIVPNLV
jgi:chitinase